MFRLNALGALLLVVFTASSAFAGRISPSLAERLGQNHGASTFRVLVFLREQADLETLDRALEARASGRADRHREVVRALQLQAASQLPLRAELEEGIRRGAVVEYAPYWISNLIVVEAHADEIARIATRADVDWIEESFEFELVGPVGSPSFNGEARDEAVRGAPPGLIAIGADRVWNELGVNGEGTLVANLDTGVDGPHHALNPSWRGVNDAYPWQACWLDAAGYNSEAPMDNHGHGTHVMGTMVGRSDVTGDTVGVAWGARWIASNGVQAVTENGIIESLQWFADPDGNPETSDDVPDVVQNSWRVIPNTAGYAACDSRWWVLIDNCEAAGVVTTWSAGNEGPFEESIGIPADRATTALNAFSIGAIDATHGQFPFSLASFSSVGPSDCLNTPEAFRIKPEVVAPGVEVRSSIPGGQFAQTNWSGTSMAGPHAAGVVSLIRQANPELSADEVKAILIATARDLGPEGEENQYGHGVIDAYAAVIEATRGYARIEGQVRNASRSGAPLAGARIELLGSHYKFTTDAAGRYRGVVVAAPYRVMAGLEGFRSDSVSQNLLADQIASHDFELLDIAGPKITPLELPEASFDTVGVYPVRARAEDASGVASVMLVWREGGFWQELPLLPEETVLVGALPAASRDTAIEYYLRAEDGAGQQSFYPRGAPETVMRFEVRTRLHYDSLEGKETAWTLGLAGDDARSGAWEWADPVATFDGPRVMQPESDHTSAPGTRCFVTGNGEPGAAAGASDIDLGCTTLLSPPFALADFDRAYLSYARWFGMGGATSDDTLHAEISSDGGATWVALESVTEPDTTWHLVQFALHDRIMLTDQVRFRMRACDLANQGVTEAALDDFEIDVFGLPEEEPQVEGPTRLLPSGPNPARGVSTLRFELGATARVRIDVYDVLGRRVRQLRDQQMAAGEREVGWDGRNDRGERVSAGLYFYRLEAGSFHGVRSVVLFR